MISFDLEYYRPDTIEEAYNTFQGLVNSGKKPVYYGGGAEIISLARVNQIAFTSVIDLKNIPECTTLLKQDNQIIMGAAVSLTQICESKLFPFFAETAKRAADHTSRNRITLGGNICSYLPYKEALLPLLVCDAQVLTAGINGKRLIPISDIFNENIKLQKGEFLVQFIIDSLYAALPFQVFKKTRSGELEYPVLSLAAIKKDARLRLAFSGVCPYPFRSSQIEEDLNNTALSIEEKVNTALSHLPTTLVNDIQASAEYRSFVLDNTLKDVLTSLEGAI